MSSQGYVQLAVTAVGTTQITALALSASSSFVQLTAGASTTGVALPANLPAGVVYYVRNDMTNSINIYPPINTSVTPIVGYGGQINALGVNLPIIISPQACTQFMSVGTNSFLTLNTNNLQLYSQTVAIADQAGVAFNLTTAQSGSYVTIAPQTVGGLALGIPTAVGTRGLFYRLQLTGTVGQIVTVTPVAGTISGLVLNTVAVGTTCVNKTAAANIEFLAAATAGSYVDLVSNGTNWMCMGIGTLSGVGWA